MGPLYKFGWFDFAYSLQIAGFVGFFFGFVLERAGFGDARKLTAIFYLKDFAVLKVMFTAIVVCALGLLYFSLFGWIDLARVHILPTYIWPQIVGGLILGVGFVMGGYCPTTAIVATVSGKLDGLIFIVGMMLGSIIFAEFFPLLQNFYEAGSMGTVRLPDLFHLSPGVIALLISLMALGAYWVAERVEQKFGNPDELPKGSPKAKRIAAGILVLMGLILAVGYPEDRYAQKPGTAPLSLKEEKAPTLQQKTAPVEKPKNAPGFKMVEDEGC
ncbi:MAG: YeeE/YedE family protein [Deltaproteobacteria bacterium]|nr:YeeE/YedE family protein [Deltaproteobacteria bacterium]